MVTGERLKLLSDNGENHTKALEHGSIKYNLLKTPIPLAFISILMRATVRESTKTLLTGILLLMQVFYHSKSITSLLYS